MDTSPLVSVVMPVYNAAPYLQSSIRSLLEQSYAHLEIIAIDDASEDESWAILQTFKDPRLKIERNSQNRGISYTRNRAIQMARGKYLANLDADDVALSHRIRKQVQFMEAHPEVGVCGAWYEIIPEQASTQSQVVIYSSNPQAIQADLFFGVSICDGAAMIRKALLMTHKLSYPENLHVAIEYELWRQLRSHCEFANLPEVLVKVRKHNRNTTRDLELKMQNTMQVQDRLLREIGIEASQEDLRFHYKMLNTPARCIDLAYLKKIDEWLSRIYWAQQTRKIYPEPFFTQKLKEIWLRPMAAQAHLGLAYARLFAQSPLSPYQHYTPWQKLKFYSKCLFHKWKPKG